MLVILGSANAMNRDFAEYILIQKQPNLLVKTASTLEGCRALVRRESDVDIVILDVSLPDMDGVNGLASLQKDFATAVPIVVMGPALPTVEIREFLRVVAAGYLPHSMNVDGIIGAINLIVAGEKYVPTDLLNYEANRRDTSMLTNREQEVLNGFMAGRSNKEIATQLALSEVTIKHHLKGLRSKLGARNRTHAVCRAIELGIT